MRINLTTKTDFQFDCDRTCPKYKEKSCRFNPLFEGLTDIVINSVTTVLPTKITYTEETLPKILQALRQAVKQLGGTWLGNQKHRLFSSIEEGESFQLPQWKYPIVLKMENGVIQFKFDNHMGAWGNSKDLEKTIRKTVVNMVLQKANELGWIYSIDENEKITIYHPNGGEIHIDPEGGVNLEKFIGTGCHSALEELGLTGEEILFKPEYNANQVQIEQGENN